MEPGKYDVYTREGAEGPEMVVHHPDGGPSSINSESLLIYTDVLATDSEGFPSEKEKGTLDDIGDTLEDAVLDDGGRSVGRIISPKQAMWLFYIRPEFNAETQIGQLLADAYPDRTFSMERGEDSTGTLAASYFPVIDVGRFSKSELGDREELQRVLATVGDVSHNCLVCYKASFSQRADARAFKHSVEGEGFVVTFCGSSVNDLWFVHFKRNERLQEDAQLSLLAAIDAKAACHGGKLEEWKVDAATLTPKVQRLEPQTNASVSKSSPPLGTMPVRVAASEARNAYYAGSASGYPRIEISGWAVACFTMALLNFCGLLSVPSIVCGFIAWKRIKESEGRLIGSKLALAGVIVSSTVLAVACLYLLLLVLGVASGLPFTRLS